MSRNYDVAFKFGCGRYIQEENAIENNLYKELKNLGKKVLFVARENGYSAAVDSIKKSLDGKDVAYEFKRFDGVPCMENAEEFVQYVIENNFEVVCGVGGGVMGDIVKLIAEIANIALVQIPTSSATCVAATPLSIMYDRDTLAFKGGYICRREADVVIVDTTILIQQPARLFWAGIIDSKAKMIEIQHYFMNGKPVPVGLEMALAVSKEVYHFYEQNMHELIEAITEKKITKKFELALFYVIAVTGIISGLSKNSSQTALGHGLYYAVRTNFCEEAKAFLHGEIVGVGLIIQLAFNGLAYEPMIDLLQRMKLPATVAEIGIEPNDQNLQFLMDWFGKSEHVDCDDEIQMEELKKAVMLIWK